MFNQIKDLYNLRKQAGEMQKQMANESVTGTSADGSVIITLNGNQEMTQVKISEDSDPTIQEMEHNIRQAYNDAQSKMKNLMMEKFKGMV
jgi:DNA-binding protein YbaB